VKHVALASLASRAKKADLYVADA